MKISDIKTLKEDVSIEKKVAIYKSVLPLAKLSQGLKETDFKNAKLPGGHEEQILSATINAILNQGTGSIWTYISQLNDSIKVEGNNSAIRALMNIRDRAPNALPQQLDKFYQTTLELDSQIADAKILVKGMLYTKTIIEFGIAAIAFGITPFDEKVEVTPQQSMTCRLALKGLGLLDHYEQEFKDIKI